MAMKTRPCEICRQLIEPDRIEGIPETRLCTRHAREIARYGGEFIVTSATESLGKVGSLKKNYGGISTQKTRNKTAVDKLRRDYEAAHERGTE